MNWGYILIQIVTIILAVEFAIWRRNKGTEKLFEKALNHGQSFDSAVSSIRESVRALDKRVDERFILLEKRTEDLERARSGDPMLPTSMAGMDSRISVLEKHAGFRTVPK